MVTFLNSTFEKIQYSKVLLHETLFFSRLEEIISISNTFAMLNLVIKHKFHFYSQIFNLRNFISCQEGHLLDFW